MSDSGVAGRWLAEARQLLQRFEETQMGAVAEAVDLAVGAIDGGGLVHLFGSGHSRIPVEEMFPRYGSFPGFHPMVELSTTFHTQIAGSNGQRQAMFVERVEGFAEQVLANFELQPPDCMMVFSAGGRSAAPIEMAMGARRRGLPVVVVTSLLQSDAAPSGHSSGTRLYDHADVIIDIGTPAADALIELDGLETPVGPGSTLVYTAVVNEIKVQTAARLVELGSMPAVITASSVVGAERSSELFDLAYADHADRYARRLRRSATGDR
ncbi:MAG: sugar isomerase domain-containing protein [Acidimicrobiia bacterium]|nr:sugar isomerase domain-containing protein [Acidimicrobiia bacterium]